MATTIRFGDVITDRLTARIALRWNDAESTRRDYRRIRAAGLDPDRLHGEAEITIMRNHRFGRWVRSCEQIAGLLGRDHEFAVALGRVAHRHSATQHGPGTDEHTLVDVRRLPALVRDPLLPIELAMVRRNIRDRRVRQYLRNHFASDRPRDLWAWWDSVLPVAVAKARAWRRQGTGIRRRTTAPSGT